MPRRPSVRRPSVIIHNFIHKIFFSETAWPIKLKFYVDDGAALQTDLDRLTVWENRWDMEFNPSKCQVVRVTTSKSEIINTVYTLHGQDLEVVTRAKYLGVDISSVLSWKSHIDIRRNIKTKIKNQKVRETAYSTLVRP